MYKDYAKDNFAINKGFLNRVREAISPHVTGLTVDVGNGGVVFNKPSGRMVLVDIEYETLISPCLVSQYDLVPLHGLFRVAGDMCHMPIMNGTMDTAIAINIIHHLARGSIGETKRRVDAAIKEACRVLITGGTLIFGENCPSDWFSKVYPFAWYLRRSLPYFFKEDYLLSKLKENGIKVKKIIHIPFDERIYNPIMPWYSPRRETWEKLIKQVIIIGEKTWMRRS